MARTRGKQRILVLGGGYAGMAAAARVAGAGAPVEVTLVDARPEFTQRIRLHEALAGSPPAAFAYAPLLARRGVRFVRGRVEGIDPAAGRAVGRGADGERLALGYDRLVVALGSVTAAPVPGVAEHVLRLDDPRLIGEAAARLGRMAAERGRVLVAGGGLTGIETAAELAERFPGLRVTLATLGRVGDGYSAAGRAHIRGRLAGLGVELAEETGVRALERGRAVLDGGGELPFDLCVWAGGFAPPALAREAGLAVDGCGRIRVDSTLHALDRPEILAAGDAAAIPFGGDAVRMGCVSALPSGAHAGASLRRELEGREPEPFDFGFVIRCVSLGRRDALIQFTRPDDAPRDRVWTGRPAVLTKEMICRMTFFVARNEMRTGFPLYRWPRGGGVTPRPAEAAPALALEGPR
ncbi:MAG: FAD-dependent oxidoreductase [Gemmatimonadetes bacterium]|nr:FAD-dependent oxidoreductase [Gemmatimonadota bacterium]